MASGPRAGVCEATCGCRPTRAKIEGSVRGRRSREGDGSVDARDATRLVRTQRRTEPGPPDRVGSDRSRRIRTGPSEAPDTPHVGPRAGRCGPPRDRPTGARSSQDAPGYAECRGHGCAAKQQLRSTGVTECGRERQRTRTRAGVDMGKRVEFALSRANMNSTVGSE